MTDKFGMGALGMSPLAGVLDSMEFVKQAWSTLNLPANLAPTMDVEEMDRRIADLKVVEQWLTMNLGMLRNSIQGMEIQRGTLAAIHAFGDAMSSSDEGGDAASRTMAALGAMQRAATAAAGAAAVSNPAEAQAPADGAPPTPTPADPGAGAAAREREAPVQATRGRASPGSLAEELSQVAVSPAAWWSLLQSQFSQVAQAALAGAGITGDAGNEALGRPGGGARSHQGSEIGPEAPARRAGAGRSTSKSASAGKRKAEPSAKTVRGRHETDASGGAGGVSRAKAGRSAPRRTPAAKVRAKGKR